jgi:hypothetical protein
MAKRGEYFKPTQQQRNCLVQGSRGHEYMRKRLKSKFKDIDVIFRLIRGFKPSAVQLPYRVALSSTHNK